MNFKPFPLAQKSAITTAIKGELDTMIRHKLNDLEKPVVILITGDADFSSSLASLRLEGYRRVLLLHTSTLKPLSAGLATESASLESIRCALGGSILVNSATASAQKTADAGGEVEHQHPASDKIMLHQYCVALHIKHLSEWDNLRDVITGNTQLAFNIGIKKKSQIITVSAETNAIVSKTLQRLRSMTDTISSICKVHTLRRWHPQHREAILKSEPLVEAEKAMEATALFYKSESNVITVEIVSTEALRARKFFDFLEMLGPIEEPLYTPKDFKLTDLEISAI